MKPVQRTFAIVALTTTLVSCGVRHSPTNTATLTSSPPSVVATVSTYPLMSNLMLAYGDGASAYLVQFPPANFQVRLDELQQDHISYFSTQHLPSNSLLWAAPIARDGIAIIAHPQIPLENYNLSLEQLRQIYNGQMTTWDDGMPIVVISREAGSGLRAEMERMVMGNRRTTANARLAFSEAQMLRQVSEQPGAIGYVSWSYRFSNRDYIVHDMTIQRMMPSPDNLYDNVYPLVTTIYIVGKSEPEDATRLFIGWIQSKEGQAVVGQTHIPLFVPTSHPDQN